MDDGLLFIILYTNWLLNCYASRILYSHISHGFVSQAVFGQDKDKIKAKNIKKYYKLSLNK